MSRARRAFFGLEEARQREREREQTHLTVRTVLAQSSLDRAPMDEGGDSFFDYGFLLAAAEARRLEEEREWTRQVLAENRRQYQVVARLERQERRQARRAQIRELVQRAGLAVEEQPDIAARNAWRWHNMVLRLLRQ